MFGGNGMSHEVLDAIERLGRIGTFFHVATTGRIFGHERLDPESYNLLIRGPYGQVAMWNGVWDQLRADKIVVPVPGDLGGVVNAYVKACALTPYALRGGVLLRPQ